MFEFFNFARKRRLNYDQLQTLQMVAQQVVLSLEGSVKIPGAAKKAIAIKLDCVTPSAFGELLEEMNIIAPDSLDRGGNAIAYDIAIEAAARLLKALDAQALPPEPRAQPVSPYLPERPSIKLDITGRPGSGNLDGGLAL